MASVPVDLGHDNAISSTTLSSPAVEPRNRDAARLARLAGDREAGIVAQEAGDPLGGGAVAVRRRREQPPALVVDLGGDHRQAIEEIFAVKIERRQTGAGDVSRGGNGPPHRQQGKDDRPHRRGRVSKELGDCSLVSCGEKAFDKPDGADHGHDDRQEFGNRGSRPGRDAQASGGMTTATKASWPSSTSTLKLISARTSDLAAEVELDQGRREAQPVHQAEGRRDQPAPPHAGRRHEVLDGDRDHLSTPRSAVDDARRNMDQAERRQAQGDAVGHGEGGDDLQRLPKTLRDSASRASRNSRWSMPPMMSTPRRR